MSIVTLPASAHPVPAVTATSRDRRIVRVGLLGLGNVGQAVVRALESSTGVLQSRGVSFRVDAALVRDTTRPRRCPRVPSLTSHPEEFLRGRYDVVIEAMGGTEPARTFVAELLGRGVAVVTANKALLAEHGEALHRIARRRGAALRYEASALAGVPFIGSLTRRPLVGSLTSITGIVNGTSNFILTSLARGGAASVAAALARAQELGYAEPDASFDVSGRDAADKLVLLLRECASVTFERSAMEVSGIEAITAADIEAARALGGTIKPVAHASIGDAVRAFVGPAFVPRSHPLAGVDDALNAVRLDGRYVGRLFFSGPGAGPDVTAATVVDDAVEVAVARGRSDRQPFREPPARLSVAPVETGWLVRVPSSDAPRLATCLGEHGIAVDRAALEGSVVLTCSIDRGRLERALAAIGPAVILRAVEV